MLTRQLYALLLAVASLTASAAIPAPDFAYPQTVRTEATARLDAALRASDSPAALRAAMDIYLARTEVDPDGFQSAVMWVDSLSATLPDPAARGLGKLFVAEAYNRYYNADRWRLDRRDLPLLPLPASVAEWSGAQLRMRVSELITEALAESQALGRTPLRTYDTVISQDAETRIYTPTLLDFVLRRGIDMMQGWNAVPHLFRASWIGDLAPLTLPGDPVGSTILDLYARLIATSPEGSAPSVSAQLGRTLFMCSNVADADRDLLRDKLSTLYDRCRGSEWAGDILEAMPRPDLSDPWARTYCAEIETFLEAHPGYWRKPCLENILADLRQSHISVETPSTIAPGAPFGVKVTMRNLAAATLRVYNVSTDPVARQNYTIAARQAMPSPVAVIPVETEGMETPFEQSVTVDVTLPKAGAYIIVPSFAGQESSRRMDYPKVYATCVALASSRLAETRLWAVDPASGAPLADTKLFLTPNTYRNPNDSRLIGTTGKDGWVKLAEGGGMVTATRGADRFAHPTYAYADTYKPSDKWYRQISGFTSLPVYHPGDTIVWSAVAYEYRAKERRPLADTRLRAVLREPSGTPIDTIEVTTDRWGRAEGRFATPQGGLTGEYGIIFDNHDGYLSVTISDYKLPTYMISGLKVLQGTPAQGDVTLAGELISYSGFPLEGTSVSVELAVQKRPRWWMPSPNFRFYSTDTIAGAGGRFEIPLTADILASAPLADSYFTATVTALTQSGESRTATISFAVSQRYVIKFDIPSNIEVSSGRLPIGTEVVDSNDSIVSKELAYTLTAKNKTILTGTMMSGEGDIDVRHIPSGSYGLRLTLAGADSIMAEAVEREIVMYRATDKSTPLPGTLLWSPEGKVKTDAAGRGAWLYATDTPTWLLVTLSADGKPLSQDWRQVSAGLSRLDVSLPDGVDEALMTVAATGGYRSASLDVTVTRGKRRGIKISTATFRDRLTPGSHEEWTLHVTDLDGEGREAAVMARLYNAALDAVAPGHWFLNPSSGYMPRLEWRGPALGETSTSWLSGTPFDYGECPAMPSADFNTYGLPLYSGGRMNGIMIRGTMRMQKSAAVTNLAAAKVEEAEADEAVLEEVAVTTFDSAATADAGTMAAGEAKSAESGEEATPEVVYRPAEVPLAFFRPTLTTDADGSLHLAFTLPDANTTWNFEALAWTPDMESDQLTEEVVASKAVMVQPNLPRFVRSGDTAVIPAMVMNATDSVAEVTVTTEFFDPSDMRVTHACDTTLTIGPRGSATIDATLHAPAGVPFAGYRVRAVSGEASDGEQTLLPVLEATGSVVESIPFYLDPDSARISLRIPTLPEGGINTLQFCANPVWYVVTALPGLIDREAFTAPEAAEAIFAASIAAGILRDNPAVVEALREWTAGNRSAEALTSLLDRNDELKMMLITANPWMSDAADDTERMTRLSLLFDRGLIDRTIRANVSLLGRLKVSDGGWAWNSRYPEYSRWATRRVLALAGRLATLGYLPADTNLSGMLRAALDRDTRETRKEYTKYPKGDYVDYLLIHDRFRALGWGKADATIATATANRLVRDWRKLGMTSRATAAILLSHNGYPRVATQVMASLAENITRIPGRGGCFKQLTYDAVAGNALILDAFRQISPASPEVKLLAQWLIMEKSAQDWGNSSATSDVIAVILATSGRYLTESAAATITAGTETLTPPAIGERLGEFVMPIPTSASGETLTLTREAHTPAWGAVISQYTDSLASLRAASCPELAISKRLLLLRPDGEPSEVDGSTQLHVGDRLRVTLTITCTQTMDYVAIRDERAACLEPVDQLPGTIVADGLIFYRENGDNATRIFIDRLPAGTYLLSYDMWVNNAGHFTAGAASAQSQYAPRFAAHSAGSTLSVNPL